jgi:hypothetical protein
VTKGCVYAALDGTVESVADTESNREAFRYSTDDECSHSPFPQARLLHLVECGTVLHCDVEISSWRPPEANGLRLLLQRWRLEKSLLLWDSGFHSSTAIFDVRRRGGHVLGRLACNILLNPHLACWPMGPSLFYIYQDQAQETRGAHVGTGYQLYLRLPRAFQERGRRSIGAFRPC